MLFSTSRTNRNKTSQLTISTTITRRSQNISISKTIRKNYVQKTVTDVRRRKYDIEVVSVPPHPKRYSRKQCDFVNAHSPDTRDFVSVLCGRLCF